MAIKKILLLFLIFFLITSDISAEIKSLKNNKTNVRLGPDISYTIKLKYKKKYLPVQIIDKYYNWRKIKDFENDTGWIHISQLQKVKSAITLNDINIFKKPSKFSKPVVKAKTGRLLLIKKCEKSWCKIETGKYSGWVEVRNLWGRN